MSDTFYIGIIYCVISLLCAAFLLYDTYLIEKITPRFSFYRYIYCSYLFAGLAAIFDCAYGLREFNVIKFNVSVSFLLTLFYILFVVLHGIFWLCYSEKKQHSIFSLTQKRFSFFLLPLVVILILIITSPYTHVFFYIDDSTYKRGILFIPVFVIISIYTAYSGISALIRSLRKDNYIDRAEYLRLFLYAIFLLVIQIIQFSLPQVFPYRSVGTMIIFEFLLKQHMLEKIDTDALTHINNRYALEHYLEEKIKSGAEFALAILDVDDFKGINDSYGHPAGDWALTCISEALITAVPKSYFISRLGGDEFVIVGDNADNFFENAEDALNSCLSSILSEHSSKFSISVSVGYTPVNGINNIPDALDMADRQLYKRKKEKHVKPR